MLNRNLIRAKSARYDEYYTQRADIDLELSHYSSYFRGKVVYCNCDELGSSEFPNYFGENFDHLGLKKVIVSWYNPQTADLLSGKEPPKTRKYIMESSALRADVVRGNGDFRYMHDELEEADVIVTNPPFSLFREFISLMFSMGKKFIVIGSINASTYNEVFPLLQSGQIRLGFTPQYHGIWFKKPGEDELMKVPAAWWTNLPIENNRSLAPIVSYAPDRYPRYDNIDAIEVPKVSLIPMDWDGVMGVPVSFLDSYSPKQFELVGCGSGRSLNPFNPYALKPKLNGRFVFKRLFVRHVKGQ